MYKRVQRNEKYSIKVNDSVVYGNICEVGEYNSMRMMRSSRECMRVFVNSVECMRMLMALREFFRMLVNAEE